MSQTPAWNLASVYPSHDSREFAEDYATTVADLDRLETLVAATKKKIDGGDTATTDVQEAFLLQEKIYVTAWELGIYLSCVLSVDAKVADARAKESQVEALISRMNQLIMPLKIHL